MTKPRKSKEERFREGIKNEILSFFELNEDRGWSLNQIHKAFAIKDRQTKLLFDELTTELVNEGKLLRHKDGSIGIDQAASMVVGKLEHVNSKFAFLVSEERSNNDVWIETADLQGAIDGDIVKVLVTQRRKKTQHDTGEVIEIIQRSREEFVGTIEILPHYAFVVPDSKRIHQDFFIAKEDIGEAKNGQKVIVKVTKWSDGKRKSEGVVKEVLGDAGKHHTEMHAILAEFGLPVRFSEAIEAEANAIADTIAESEIAKRRDMRGITTFTIDPLDAKDFDDALSFQWLDNGHYEIGVHIADVTHYIQPGTPLEEEAFKRATSVYLVDRVVPMLPEKLSNGLCSLRPHEDKLTFSAVFELDDAGTIHHEWFGRTVIHSDKRFTYEEAQAVLEWASDPNNEPVPFQQELTILNTLAHVYRKQRFDKGAINFETVEVKFNLDEQGTPLGIYQKVRKDAHKLIEEFMLLANKRVAEYVYNLRQKEPRNTMVYRIHEAPDPEKLRTFSSFVKKFGYNVNVDSPNISQALNDLMLGVEGKPEQNIVESLAIRTMSKARYSTEPIGHFGLAFPFYSHFTSPIRRYPDMMAHRLLQHYLDGGQPVDRVGWEQRCKHSSEMEKVASEAERASIKYKQIEYMSLLDDQRTWQGIISGVTEFGIFVEITETASEGLVRMVDLNDDYYEYDRDNFRIVGQRNGRVFTFGDAVEVRVKECNLARRSLDLLLVNLQASEGRKKASSGARHKEKRERKDRKKSFDKKKKR